MPGKFSVVKSIKEDGDNMIVELFGSLTVDTADDFVNALNGKLDNVSNLILDMKMMAYITSAGLRGLVRIIKDMSAHGGKVTVRHVNKDVMNVFELMNVQTLVTVED